MSLENNFRPLVLFDRRSFLRAALLVPLAPRISAAWSRRFFVDAEGGDDALSGSSSDRAWRSLERINRATFEPGDEILLKRGGRWRGTLRPQGGGTADHAIRIASYGEGPRPFIDGEKRPAVLIYNQDAWSVEGLEVTNHKDSGQDAMKVWAEPRRPHFRRIRIRDCVAHGAGGSGIRVGDDTYGNYDDVIIEDCISYNNQESGIFIRAKDFAEVRDLAIRRSVAYGNGWDGIKIYNGRDGVIEHCVAYRNGWKHDARVGIWCWMSENITIQFCESYENVTPGAHDGGGFDIDWSSRNSVIQYCYSHDNDGAGYLFMGSGRGFTTGSAVRFNISQNDGRKNDYGGILCYGTLQNSDVHNNAVFYRGSEAGAALHFRGSEEAGYPSNVRVLNNILMTDEGRAVLRIGREAAQRNNLLDFNLHFAPGAKKFIWGAEEFSDFEAFRNASGQEAHGLSADPRFRGAGQGGRGRIPLNAYRLLPDSPCRGAGTEYSPEFGSLDYWGRNFLDLRRMSIGPEQ